MIWVVQINEQTHNSPCILFGCWSPREDTWNNIAQCFFVETLYDAESCKGKASDQLELNLVIAATVSNNDQSHYSLDGPNRGRW